MLRISVSVLALSIVSAAPVGAVTPAKPAPRPMDYMKITNEGGKLVVDTGSIKRRDKWDPTQAFKA